MPKKYTPAIFQATVRPSWAGTLHYIPVEERSAILEAIIKYPEETGIKSVFWEETIKPDLKEQYDKFLKICEIRGRSAKTYWGSQGNHKDNISYPNDIQKDNLFKDKDKDKDNNKVKDKIKYNHYGELNNVCLLEEDYNKLLSIYPNLPEAIEVLDTWLGTSGSKNKNKNHYAYFKSNSWVWERVKPKQIERKKTQAELIDEHNLSYIEKIMEENYNG